MSFTRAKIGIRVPKRWIYSNMEEREGGGSKPQPCGLQTKVFIIERAALCCCSIFKHFCSFMVYKDLWPLKLYFQHERAGFGLNQCVSAGLQLSEAVVWGGEVGVSLVRRVMEQQQSPSCCCVLVLHHTMGSWEGPWCLHQERGSAWIRIHPKITWFSTIIMFSTVFAR